MTEDDLRDDQAVLGLDNIALDLPLAGIGSRVMAVLIDYLLLSVLFLVVILGGGLALSFADLPWGLDLAILLLAVFTINWGYFIAFELLWSGQTPGKRAVGLRVVGRRGGTPGGSGIWIRNLVRDIDVLVGAVLIVSDPMCRRLGDRLGGTLVVHDRPPQPAPVVGRLPDGWGAREAAVVEALLERADELEGDRAEQLAERLLRLVARQAPQLLEDLPGDVPALDALRAALAVRET